MSKKRSFSGKLARERVLREHTFKHRAAELINIMKEVKACEGSRSLDVHDGHNGAGFDREQLGATNDKK